jgi:hypothetical protein
MRWLLIILLFMSCGETPDPDLPERERCIPGSESRECVGSYIALVCYNPNSIWHLSECPEDGRVCERRSLGDAYCLALTERMCQVPPDMLSDFVRSACALHGQ